ncbi:MAG: histidine kinase [Bacteroidetes bacterium]|nr:histidine kinase [Bacteroidota bacterium]
MIRDAYLRMIFIPLFGIAIAAISGMITFENYSLSESLLAITYFIFVSLCIWAGCTWIHGKLRIIFRIGSNPIIKIISISLLSTLYGVSIVTILSLIWLRLSIEPFSWHTLSKTILFTSCCVIAYTLLYEVIFLSKEREIDNEVVNQLDMERTHAEIALLQNELDPHFIFNSLTTLSYLINTEPDKAQLFNSKLAEVYKYFLVNKNRELIDLGDELDFIEGYFYLLQIRHDNKLSLQATVNPLEKKSIRILPCALQILVENAIKHNEFTSTDPLLINIDLNGKYLKISNNIKRKTYNVNSTKIGLQNLSSRYRLVCKKDIEIEKTENRFIVKLPIIN